MKSRGLGDVYKRQVFVGITYLLLFGAMFGDVGQGAIFILVGWLVSKKWQKDMGGLLMRMGGASVIFGFLYGSVFGNEEIIDALWMRPFQNIEQVLGVAIGFGVILLVPVSYTHLTLPTTF